MRIIALSFLLGTLIIQFFQTLPSLLWMGLFFSISIVALLFIINSHFINNPTNGQYKSISQLITAFLAGLFLASATAHYQLNQQIPSRWEGQNILVTGKVDNLPDKRTDGTRLRLNIQQAYLQSNPQEPIKLSGIIRLGWFQNAKPIGAGETWQLLVRLKKPSGFMNPGGFDYEKWLFTERITATGYVRKSDDENQRLVPAPWWSINQLRQTIHHEIQQNVEDKSAAAILSALVVAVRTKFDDAQWKLLTQTGTSHLVAISGLHIAVVAGFAFLPIMLIWGLFPRLNERVPRHVAGAVAGVVFATVYAMLAGFTLPTQRALLMVVIALLGLLVRRNFQVSSILAVVMIAVLLLDPLAGMTVSFWLSFLAVALILIMLNRQLEKPALQLIKLQIALSLSMFPLTLFFFGSASLLSPIANIVAIPWVSLVVVPLSLLGLVFMPISAFISNGLLSIAALAVKWMFIGFEWLTRSPLADISLAKIPSIYLLFAFAGVLFLLLPKGFPAKWLGLLALLPALLFAPERPKQGEFNYTLLDAGQGMASVLQTAEHTLIYDVGTRYSKTYDIGKLVVVPYLKAQGIKTVDNMILSHKDVDHWGGAGTVLKALNVDKIISSDPSILSDTVGLGSDIKNQKIFTCTEGNSWQWDGVNFEILSPAKAYNNDTIKDNNRSCVLRISNKNHALLLTADIEKKVENRLLSSSSQSNKNIYSNVISVPHHGSKTSSTLAFIKAVNPTLALIPAGYRNRFGHPKAPVLARYKHLKVKVLNTADSGAVALHFPADKSDFKVETYREKKRGFWNR